MGGLEFDGSEISGIGLSGGKGIVSSGVVS